MKKIGLFIAIFGLVPIYASESIMSSVLGGIANEGMQIGKIAVGSVAAAVTYGIVNDMITARICPEYFTEGFHRNMVESQYWYGRISKEKRDRLLNPKNINEIALYWGVNATWWFGAGLSVPVIAAARIGSWPKLGIEELAKPLAVGLGGLLATGMIAGAIGYRYANNNPKGAYNIVANSGAYKLNNDPSKQQGYVVDTFAHHAGYAGGAVLGAGIVGYTLLQRYKQAYGL